MTVLSHLLGTPYMPDLEGHVLMLEEVSEHMYRIDRAMFHITSIQVSGRLPASGSAVAAPFRPTIPNFGKRKKRLRSTGASAPASPISAAPISGMIATTRSCRSDLRASAGLFHNRNQLFAGPFESVCRLERPRRVTYSPCTANEEIPDARALLLRRRTEKR